MEQGREYVDSYVQFTHFVEAVDGLLAHGINHIQMLGQLPARRGLQPLRNTLRTHSQDSGLRQGRHELFIDRRIARGQPHPFDAIFFFAQGLAQLTLKIQVLLTSLIACRIGHTDQQPLALE